LNDDRSDGGSGQRSLDLRLLSCRTDLSGKSALAEGVGLLGVGTGAGA
jgi:hypothetical protein